MSHPESYDSYVVADGGGDKFYDDNEWLGQDFVHACRLTGDRRRLDKAEVVWAFVISGWSDAMGGGIYWKQYDISTKNTTSNAPAVILALMLHQETGDREYAELRLLDQATIVELAATAARVGLG